MNVRKFLGLINLAIGVVNMTAASGHDFSFQAASGLASVLLGSLLMSSTYEEDKQ
jgi:hypothetical protein